MLVKGAPDVYDFILWYLGNQNRDISLAIFQFRMFINFDVTYPVLLWWMILGGIRASDKSSLSVEGISRSCKWATSRLAINTVECQITDNTKLDAVESLDNIDFCDTILWISPYRQKQNVCLIPTHMTDTPLIEVIWGRLNITTVHDCVF